MISQSAHWTFHRRLESTVVRAWAQGAWAPSPALIHTTCVNLRSVNYNKWKKLDSKDYLRCNSIYMAFWKRQSCSSRNRPGTAEPGRRSRGWLERTLENLLGAVDGTILYLFLACHLSKFIEMYTKKRIVLDIFVLKRCFFLKSIFCHLIAKWSCPGYYIFSCFSFFTSKIKAPSTWAYQSD